MYTVVATLRRLIMSSTVPLQPQSRTYGTIGVLSMLDAFSFNGLRDEPNLPIRTEGCRVEWFPWGDVLDTDGRVADSTDSVRKEPMNE